MIEQLFKNILLCFSPIQSYTDLIFKLCIFILQCTILEPNYILCNFHRAQQAYSLLHALFCIADSKHSTLNASLFKHCLLLKASCIQTCALFLHFQKLQLTLASPLSNSHAKVSMLYNGISSRRNFYWETCGKMVCT